MAATGTTIGGALAPNPLGVEAAAARSGCETAIRALLEATGGGNAVLPSTPAATRHLGHRTRLAD